jgi:hypothetical protein
MKRCAGKIALLSQHDVRSRWCILFIKVMVYFKAGEVVEMKLLFHYAFLGKRRGKIAGFKTRDGGINSEKQLPQYAQRNSSSLSS